MFEGMTIEELADYIAAKAEKYRNWGRWGEDDRVGTLNFIDTQKRLEAARLVKRGETFTMGLDLGANGPQTGFMGRTNPVHTFVTNADDHIFGRQGFPHGVGGADDVVFMPLQSATHWDGLGHMYDRGRAWNGRVANEVVTPAGDLVTGIEHATPLVTSRGVLLDIGRAVGGGELEDGFAITEQHILETIERQGETSRVGRGDIVVVRTGQLERARAKAWEGYTGGDAPGFSLATVDWLHRTEIAAIAIDTWGFEVRPYEVPDAFSPLHQILIPNVGMIIGEMWDVSALAADCAATGVYEFLLVASPLPFTGAVGAPVSPVAIK